MDGPVVFARWRQCASARNTCFLWLTRVQIPSASRPVQPFLHSSPQRVPILYSGPPLPHPSKLPLLMGIWIPSNTWFHGPTQVLNLVDISDLKCLRTCRKPGFKQVLSKFDLVEFRRYLLSETPYMQHQNDIMN